LDRVTLFLRNTLFSANSNITHLPRGVAIIDAEIVDRPAGALTVKATAYRDARDRALEGTPYTLTIPWHKIDHLLVRD
jgi:hypothetical protein